MIVPIVAMVLTLQTPPNQFQHAAKTYETRSKGVSFGEKLKVNAWASAQTKHPLKPTPELERLLDDAKKKPDDEKMEAYLAIVEKAGAVKDRVAENRALSEIGWIHKTASQFQMALEYYTKALAVALEAGDLKGEGDARKGTGAAYHSLTQPDKALELYQQALAIYREIQDRKGVGDVLYNIGLVHSGLGQKQKALEFYEQALPIYREVKHRGYEGDTLNLIGGAYSDLGQKQKALEFYEQALVIRREVKDRKSEGNTLHGMASVYSDLGQRDKALELYEQALVIRREVKDRKSEGSTLHGMGIVYYDLGQRDKALELYEQALVIRRDVKDRSGEGNTLFNMGLAYSSLGKNQKALELHEQALEIYREVKHRAYEGDALHKIGSAHSELGQKQKALKFYEQALTIRREVKNRIGEANTLQEMAIAYSDLGQKQRALEFYDQTLVIRREVKDRSGEGDILYNIASVYSDLGQKQEALEFYEKALAIYQETKRRKNEADAYYKLGFVQDDLGEGDKALESYQSALAIYRELKDRDSEGDTLNDIGVLYWNSGRKLKVLEFFTQAVEAYRETKNYKDEGDTLRNIGELYDELGPKEKKLEAYEQAMTAFNQALETLRQAKDRAGEGFVLNGMGLICYAIDQKQKALEYHQQALLIHQELGTRFEEAETSVNISVTLKSLKSNALAIIYGKRAVNVWQSIRTDNRGLDKKSQSSFKEIYQDKYRELAALLVEEGRLGEAQQVMDLLKDDEYFRLLRRRASDETRVDLTKKEKIWLDRYEKVALDIASIAAKFEAEKKTAPPEKLKAYRDELAKAQTAFQEFLTALNEAFKAVDASTNRLDDLKGSEALARVLTKLPGRPAAVYTLVTKDGVRMILSLPGVPVLRKAQSNLASKELNQKIFDFRQALRDPRLDPRPLGAELYDVLIRPLEKDLEGAGSKTILWSLDANLRYVPMWALYDSKAGKYLIEKYPSSVFTPRTVDRLTESPEAGWSGVGFAVSQRHQIGDKVFPALSGALEEAAVVAKVLRGQFFEDGKFTEQRLLNEALKAKVVHVVSHFFFKPGDEDGSFLLLGDGKPLTMATFKTLPDNAFSDVDLLVLSACDTAMSSGSDGSEFEGFALLAQLKGAGSVVATLWPVADESTAVLMAAFYRERAAHPEITKLEALRRVQLKMLRGDIRGPESTSARAVIPANGLEKFPFDKQKPYAHPYYWAPFVMFGNFK